VGAGVAEVVYERNGPVATIRLDRPERLNAFTFAMVGAIRAAVERAARDDQVVGIVITGTGRAFCAGLDVGDLARSTSSGPQPVEDGELPALFSYLLAVPKPVVAAINGVAAGGGFVLAMMADLRFAAESDASFTTAFSRRGLIAEHATAWILPRLVGTNRALDWLWSARRVDAAEAHHAGFVDRLVPPERLLPEARAYLEDLAAHASPRSIAVMKAQVYRGLSQSLEVACQDADAETRLALAHPDAREGVASFVERRPPAFAPVEVDG